MVTSLRKFLCIALLIGCGDDAESTSTIDAGSPCLTACTGDAGLACQLGDASYDQVLATFRALCSTDTKVFSASCENSTRALVIGSGYGNTTIFFSADGGQLGVRTDDEGVDPTCDGHAYSPVVMMCNGTIGSDICDDAPIGSVFY